MILVKRNGIFPQNYRYSNAILENNSIDPYNIYKMNLIVVLMPINKSINICNR